LGKRFLNLTFALGLVIGLMAGVVGSASAADTTPSGTSSQWIYFPYVPNGAKIGTPATGPWYGTVTIQNVEDFRVDISFGQTAAGVTPNLSTTLEAHASKTFTVTDLGIASPGAGVVVGSSWDLNPPGQATLLARNGICQAHYATATVTRGTIANSNPPAATTTDLIGGTVLNGYEMSTYIVQVNPDGSNTYYYAVGAVVPPLPAPGDTQVANAFNVLNDNTISWVVAGPVAGSTYTVHYVDSIGTCRAPVITGVEKHVSAVPSTAPAQTSAAQVSVDGYTAIPEQDVPWGPASKVCQTINDTNCFGSGGYTLGNPAFGTFDGHSYLPIVQTNNGWDSVINITDMDPTVHSFASVTVTFYQGAGANTSGGNGAWGTSVGSFTALVAQGATTTIDLATVPGLPTDFVGSAWITSDYGVVADVNRQKSITNMALTNTAAPSLRATTSPSACGNALCFGGGGNGGNNGGMFTMVAPLVFQSYNGWNTGLNIANISEFTNTVTVTWVGPTGNVVGSDSVTLPAKAMEYIYRPSTMDLGLTNGYVGAAVLTSLLPFHAAVDEVKYTDPSNPNAAGHGQAMSYIATDAGASAAFCYLLNGPFGQPVCAPNGYNGAPNGAGSYDIGGPTLNIPLIQRGSTLTGMGDFSGINLFNASAQESTTDWVRFYQPSGALEAPTLNAPYQIVLGPLNTATIYTGQFNEMSTGFQGSAQVEPVSGGGVIFGVSNNVNYAVNGDGSAVYNAVNSWGQFRLDCSQTGIVDNSGNASQFFGGCIYFTPNF